MKKTINLFITAIFLVLCINNCAPASVDNTELNPTESQFSPSPSPLPRSIVIVSADDSGPGTLRQALLDAEDSDVIEFEPEVFPPDDPTTIKLVTELPFIEKNNLIIDASNAGVIIDGSQITTGWIAGLQIVSADEVKIMGIHFMNFPGPGIAISGNSTRNIIGGSRVYGSGPYGQGNLFSHNERAIDLSTSSTTKNTLVGNLIGTDGVTVWQLGNQAGIWISEGAHDNYIGPDNTIAYNNGPGIVVDGTNSLANTISQNSIYDNVGIDIDLRSGGNAQLGAPVIQYFNLAMGTVVGNTCSNCQVDLFADSFVDSIKADAGGHFEYDSETSFRGTSLRATATDEKGNTSGFSLPTSGMFVSSEPPTYIFYDGIVLTMDNNHSTAEAIAIVEETILAVGENDMILALAGENTQIVDLNGKVLMPGFIDSHDHLMEAHKMNFNEEQELILENGVTTIGILYATQEWIDELTAFDQQTGLRIRVNLYLSYNNSCGEIYGNWYTQFPPTEDKSERIRIAGVKVYSDGGGCNSPAVSYEYPDGGNGDLYFTQDEMTQLVREINANGYQVAIHALGDRAIEQVLNAYAEVNNDNQNVMHNRIEHNTLVRDDMLGLHDKSNAVAVIFGHYPTCYFLGLNEIAKSTTPEELKNIEWRWKDLIEANPNTIFAWHTDVSTVYAPKYFGIFTLNPFVNLNGYVTRREYLGDGNTCEPEEWMLENTITVDEALPIMTINSAYALNMDDVIGSLEPGKLADLIIISDNPLTISHEKLYDINVLMTMVGGNIEFCAQGNEGVCSVH